LSKLINIIKDKFEVIPAEIFHDKRLCFRDRGLLCTLLSLPDGWQFTSTGLALLVSEAGKERREGRDAIRASLTRLETLGYLERVQVFNERGKFAGYDFKLNIPPIEVSEKAEQMTFDD
jgi:hypothetical protein